MPVPSFLAQPSVRGLQPLLVTEIDGARLLGIGRAQMKGLIAEGEVVVVDVAGDRRVSVESIVNYVGRLTAAGSQKFPAPPGEEQRRMTFEQQQPGTGIPADKDRPVMDIPNAPRRQR